MGIRDRSCGDNNKGGSSTPSKEEQSYDFGGMKITFADTWGKDLTPGKDAATDALIAKDVYKRQPLGGPVDMRLGLSNGKIRGNQNVLDMAKQADANGDVLAAINGSFFKLGASYGGIPFSFLKMCIRDRADSVIT